jgi:hypothetical protein
VLPRAPLASPQDPAAVGEIATDAPSARAAGRRPAATMSHRLLLRFSVNEAMVSSVISRLSPLNVHGAASRMPWVLRLGSK